MAGNPRNILKTIGQNITGDKPTDPLGDIIHSVRGFLTQETAPDPTGGPPTGKGFKDYLPEDKSGEIPESYTPDESEISSMLSGAKPGSGILGVPSAKELEGTLTDSEYETLEKESSRGNQLAMNLLDAYKPKYGLTSTQQEQQLVQPFVNEDKSLPSTFNALEQQQQTQDDNQLPSALAQVQQTAQQYSGISPQAPNAQTSALMNQYMSTASTAMAQATPVMDAGLKDLGTAAEISVKSFPYESLISDLLNRYAYQLESPSYPAPPIKIAGLSPALQKLFAASTGSQYGGGGLTAPSTLGTPDSSGLTTPALAPASNPSSTG